MINFKNSYIEKLNNKFYTKINPLPVKKPELIYFNNKLAKELNIDYESANSYELGNIFSGNKVLAGSVPIALAYAGHQFGHFVPKLGDGRAVLLGEITDIRGITQDIQLKGSGKTPYSRNGDGRAAIGPMIREYIVSEAMHSLKVKTTRSLALVQTGEFIMRSTIMPSAILTRVAMGHIRIGTFEYFTARSDLASIKLLADYIIDRHYPSVKKEPSPYLSLIEQVIDAQVNLVTDWMRVGFIHGVMNTDNTSVSGETIDYGPCAFMDEYNHNKFFSSIDTFGRYSYGNQANILLWNLIQFFNSLKELITKDIKVISDLHNKLVHRFVERYEIKWLKTMGNKIGIIYPIEEDRILLQLLFNIMQINELDFTLTFIYLTHHYMQKKWMNDYFLDYSIALKDWIVKWEIRVNKQKVPKEQIILLMNNTNPNIIPRNHIIEQVINEALKHNNFEGMHKMISLLENPYSSLEEKPLHYILPPKPENRIKATFCGT